MKGIENMQRVTSEQIAIIDKVLVRYNGDKAKAAMHFIPSKGLTMEKFTRCMIEGYEEVKSKEKQIKDLYESYHRQGVSRGVIRKVLKILEVHVDGVTNDN